MNSVNLPKLQLEFLHILGPSVALGMHRGMEANLNIKAGYWQWKTTKRAPKLQLDQLHVILGHDMALGMHQGMEVNLNIKQAAGNAKPQKECPNRNWSAHMWHLACIRAWRQI